ncbi:cell division protein FtsL [Polynucleobacter sphagniphilus]|jgi:cell division protein FtsL|uniref:Cell division protein FtsL n=1 Tax=Polynucleobacter sphagniphilus TaxID=1743169 RepID=A0AA43M973_9BURK|nr:cell division protein FtsL [Polynucleobacter sphagniphilus]MDF9787724.1 cell division protein FtsL [Polynucleobacter sphagniphilus]MDH6153894.1 cell division protein FtsL [Polynucleobacter sphagniphilus]MDH6248543.1 cell division protein FtsL [Polynucleobacter sphagniphilus]MDH6302030.1 cell division protein FtsL [Polynucleobacter sphagniphilus]MDH6421076.1 cell division protein FtsL [Polynucleobacter sphagniphilus]
MNRATLTLLSLLLVCALSLVAAQQHARRLFVSLEQAQIEERRLNQDWLRLEYEQRNLSKSARIRDVARNQLNMVPISPDRTVYLKEAK